MIRQATSGDRSRARSGVSLASPIVRTLASVCLALAPAAAHALEPAKSPPLPASTATAPPSAAPAPQASPDAPGAVPGSTPGAAPGAAPPGYAPGAPPGAAPPGYAPAPGYPPGYGPPPGYGQPGYPGYPPPGYAPPGYAPYPYYPPYPYYTAPPAPPPSILPYEEGQDVPQGYHVETRVNRKLVVAGAAVLGGTWAFSALVAGLVMGDNNGNDKGYAPLFAPVLGPFIAIGTSHLDFGRDGGLGAFLILDGIAQVGAATMLVIGLVKDKHVLVRDPAARAPKAALVPELGVGLGSTKLTWRF